MNNLDKLPPAEKKVVAQELIKAGYSNRTLEDLIGADHTTISRWAKEDTPEQMQQFATQVKSEIGLMKQQGVGMVHDRLLALIPKEERISEVVRAGEFLEGKNQPVVAIQNNNYQGVEFVMDDKEL